MGFFCLICFCLCVHRYEYTRVQAAGSRPVGQMSQPDENLIPGHNLGNNTHCCRNLMHTWKRPTKLKEVGKNSPECLNFKILGVNVAKILQVRCEQLSLEVTQRQELHEQMHRMSW